MSTTGASGRRQARPARPGLARTTHWLHAGVDGNPYQSAAQDNADFLLVSKAQDISFASFNL